MLNLEIQLMRYSSNSSKLNPLLRLITPFQKPKVSKSSKKVYHSLESSLPISLLPSPSAPITEQEKKSLVHLYRAQESFTDCKFFKF